MDAAAAAPEPGQEWFQQACRSAALPLQGEVEAAAAQAQAVLEQSNAATVDRFVAAWVLGGLALDQGRSEEGLRCAEMALRQAARSGRPDRMNLAGELRRRANAAGRE